VHHLAGLSASLMSVIRRRNLPIVYQIQDWWAMCARANLWHVDDSLCPGPSPARCARCLPLTRLAPRGPLNNWMYRARRRYLRRQLRLADAYVMGSRAVHRWYSEADFLNPAAAVHVLDYGVGMPGRHRDSGTRRDGPLTFGFIGALMPHKGAHVAVEALRGINPNAARLLIWGDSEARPDYTTRIRARAETHPVEIRGRFDDRAKAEILASIDVLIVPSVGLESFGIAAREAMAAGVPVLAARRGALEELDIDGICGATVTPDDPNVLRSWIDRLIENPETLDEWQRSLPAATTVAEHATAIDRIYRQVVGGTE
jgi:glycosyltransferase involved in cell wall biosynthesis